jgi:hypothetical protein
MNRLAFRLIVFVVCWLGLARLQAASPEIDAARKDGANAKITFCVVNSIGSPVEDAKVDVGFYNPHKRDDGMIAYTKTDGYCSVSGVTDSQMHYTISKPGFYTSESAYWFDRRNDPKVVKDGRWQPWNPTNTVILKERRNPIPMYARNVRVVVPIMDRPIGFDLEKADLVAPYGKGSNADVYVSYAITNKDFLNYSNQITLLFSNQQDGFIRLPRDAGSEFESTYEAPTNGYQKELVLRRSFESGRIIKQDEIAESEYLVFRVRTIVDEKGNLVSARYGKLDAAIGHHKFDFGRFDSDGKTGGFLCSCYFNPSGTRNLEFDPKQNLFTNLPPFESKVYKP